VRAFLMAGRLTGEARARTEHNLKRRCYSPRPDLVSTGVRRHAGTMLTELRVAAPDSSNGRGGVAAAARPLGESRRVTRGKAVHRDID
jgi:hypothetical protein